MASIEELKQRIDLHDLADKLGLSRPASKGNYRSPNHNDKSPSLSVFETPGGQAWKDHSNNVGGSCIDLVCYVKEMEVAEAIVYLHEEYGLPLDKRNPSQTQNEPKTLCEFIADKCFDKPEATVEYLKGRAISESVIHAALKRKTIGWNEWTSDKIAAGQAGHGGPACAFIVRDMHTRRVVAVDMRYKDAALNGNVKTQCQGEKYGYPWFNDLKEIKKAHTVYVVESPINALSIETSAAETNSLKGVAVVAVRGVNVDPIDWTFLTGKRVLLCFDNDRPDEKGLRAGLSAAWKLHELLLGLNISAQFVDQADWAHNDVNDILQAEGPNAVVSHIQKIEPWVIPGMPGRDMEGKSRLYLPSHDFSMYWKYRAKADFTTFVKDKETDDAGGEREIFADLCGFRVAGLSRVTIASATATMSGEQDAQPNTVFAVSVQTPRHQSRLIRRVFEDEKLHNADQWTKFGPIFNKPVFSRMLTILERAADIGSRNAANFVGLCWRDGRLAVNEGPDCYFMDPEKQCPYHNLTFPSGPRSDGRRVVEAYQETFKQNAATMMLVWGLGAHLKALLGFWPHMTLQSDKGAGKSTLIKRLERTIGFTMFSGQSLQTEFRLLTSISHTSHPVGWEELSARRQDVIDKAVAMLQESYQYTVSRRGSDMTEYVLSAPVLLAGEDVPVRSLTGKLVRTDISGKKGPMMPEDLPRFPVRQWLGFLTTKPRNEINSIYQKARLFCLDKCRARTEDNGALRMAGNYAAMFTAWKLLCEFLDIPTETGSFVSHLLAEMNSHIGETSADREPWVMIMETIISDIESGNYRHPYKFDEIELVRGERNMKRRLVIRTSHMMDHLSHTPALREKWNALSVKSDRVFKKQCVNAGVIVNDDVEYTHSGKRHSHMVAFGLEELQQYGLFISEPEHIHVQ